MIIIDNTQNNIYANEYEYRLAEYRSRKKDYGTTTYAKTMLAERIEDLNNNPHAYTWSSVLKNRAQAIAAAKATIRAYS